jgi:hypothetical protein
MRWKKTQSAVPRNWKAIQSGSIHAQPIQRARRASRMLAEAQYFWTMFWLQACSVSQWPSPTSSIMVTLFSVRVRAVVVGCSAPSDPRSQKDSLWLAQAVLTISLTPPGTFQMTTARQARPPRVRITVSATSVHTTASIPPIAV